MTAPQYRPAFWIGLAAGGALMAFGAVGLVSDTGIDGTVKVGGWLVGADVAHDFVIAPLACLIGAAVARALPRLCRAPIQAALLTSGVLLVVVFPALRGFGHDQVPDNSSVQPLDYTTATLTALAAVWAVAAVWLGVRLASARWRRRQPPIRATPEQGSRPAPEPPSGYLTRS